MPEHGIHTIDTGFHRPCFDAAYLVVEDGCAAFIDCGTKHSVPRMMAALDTARVRPENVHWLILTHVHLDHAGGAGALMQRLPRARLLVHPRGARHMIDPRKLWAGASAVYGEAEMQRSYGELVPIPEQRVVEATDGYGIELAGRRLECVDTPGHARHHHCIWDEASRSWFSGDTFGLSYREFDSSGGPFVIPTTSPVQFDPDALHASIERLLARQPAAIYMTHYGRVEAITAMARELHHDIDAMVDIALEHERCGDDHAALVAALDALYAERARRHGCPQTGKEVRALLDSDIELNAQGLEVWLQRRRRDHTAAPAPEASG